MMTVNAIVQALHTVKLNTLRPVKEWPHVRVEVSTRQVGPVTGPLQRRVDFQAIFEATAWIDANADGEAILQAHRRAARHLTEIVFGDLRVSLHAIEHALAERDVDKAQALVADLYRGLFDGL